MRRLLASLLLACAHAPPIVPSSPDVHLALVHDTTDERQTKAQLESLFARYDLSPWRFTSEIAIDEQSTPHSHPVLTLHTRHLKDDLLLLSTYIHEQSHWCFEANPAETVATVGELEPLFPGLPVGFPDGAMDAKSSYEHLMVIAFEWRGLRSYVGELASRQAMEFWSKDHYRAIYAAVLADPSRVWTVLDRHGFHVPDRVGHCRG